MSHHFKILNSVRVTFWNNCHWTLGFFNFVLLSEHLNRVLADNESCNNFNYCRFCSQLLHTSLQKILEPVRQYMTAPKIVCCPDSHYCRVIFLLGLYIVDYPEQCLLSNIVQGWCPGYICNYLLYWHTLTICFRCNAPSKNIDCGRFIQHLEAHTELLCKSCEMAELWDNYGIVGDVKVIY